MTRPNLILIVSDDQGPWALGAAGNHEIRTPVLDDLAQRGIRLDRFFCTSPVCSPARASLLTGQVPSTHGVHDYLDGAHTGSGSRDHLRGMPTLTDALADAGYRLGLSGKWHLGASDVPRRGFVHWYALHGGGSPYHDAVMYRDGVAEHVTDYLTDVIADDAVAFIDAEQEQDAPFFLALNFTAPHKPFAGQHPDEFTDLYRDCAFETCPQEQPHPWLQTLDGAPIGGEADTREALIGYFAAVSAMDAAIGRVLDRLTVHGIQDDTIVVFLSDNGFSCGHHGIWGKGNGTYPLNFWDNSVRVPCVVHLPGGATGASNALLSSVSLHRTLCELAGVSVPEDRWGAGASFAHVLRGEDSGGEDFVVVASEYGGARMITDGQNKLVERFDGPGELYNLEKDPRERDNLFNDPFHDGIRRRLSDEMERRFAQHGRPGASGWERPVTGFGQVHPVSRGIPDEQSYVQGREGLDGVR